MTSKQEDENEIIRFGDIGIGLYCVEESDKMYQAYSGYKYLVMYYQGLIHKQLKGFKENQLEEAKRYCEKKFKEQKEVKEYNATMQRVKETRDKPDEWTSRCVECGGTMRFQKNLFRYICPKCGNILEV